jgi:uncharacterized protein YdaU (DUF1376 family)
MHYYQFNIGDYKSHTSHLTIIEDIAYRRILDMYYLHEKPLDNSIPAVARLIGMREYESEVEMVLLEFFVCPDEGGWINPRADKEISVYKGFSDAGKRGAAKRWLTGGDSHPITPPIATKKHKPLNIKQETDKPNTTAQKLLATLEISKSVADDFIALRNRLKAPITQTSLNGIQREALKARLTLEAALQICCERSWRGFKAEWIQDQGKKSNGVQDARLEVARQIMGDSNGNDRSFIDITETSAIENSRKGISKALDGFWEPVDVEVAGD